MINLRKAEDSDVKNIAGLIESLRLDMAGFVWNDIGFIEKQIKNGEYFLAESAGNILGIMSLRQRKKTIHIETLAVAPEHRLKKIGSQLVGFAKTFTKEKGLRDLCACSFFDYHIGDFYTRQGFSLLPRPGEYYGRKYHIFVIKI